MNRLIVPMRDSIDTPQLRRVRTRSWYFSRLIAFGATRILTCGPSKQHPNPSGVASAACRIEDFSRFTFSLSRRSITPQTLSTPSGQPVRSARRPAGSRSLLALVDPQPAADREPPADKRDWAIFARILGVQLRHAAEIMPYPN